MKRKIVFSLAVVLALLLPYILFVPYKKEVNLTLSGYCCDLQNTSEHHEAQISINGTAKCRLMGLIEFDGSIIIEDASHPVNMSSTYIQFGNGLGQVNSYENSAQLDSYSYVGYICTTDFNKLLFMYYDENSEMKYHRYFVAPTESVEEAVFLAEQLSDGTILSNIKWN